MTIKVAVEVETEQCPWLIKRATEYSKASQTTKSLEEGADESKEVYFEILKEICLQRMVEKALNKTLSTESTFSESLKSVELTEKQMREALEKAREREAEEKRKKSSLKATEEKFWLVLQG